ncbi:MAG: hypothetical protein ACI8TE_001296 [Francisella sp.]
MYIKIKTDNPLKLFKKMAFLIPKNRMSSKHINSLPMKNINLLAIILISLPTYSFSFGLKGSDFMSTDVGAKYTYTGTVESYNITPDLPINKIMGTSKNSVYAD